MPMTPSLPNTATESLRAIMRSFEFSVVAPQPVAPRSRSLRPRARIAACPVSPIRAPKS